MMFLNSHLWCHVIDRAAEARPCLAVDLLAHGTRTVADRDVPFDTQAQMPDALCRARLISGELIWLPMIPAAAS